MGQEGIFNNDDMGFYSDKDLGVGVDPNKSYIEGTNEETQPNVEEREGTIGKETQEGIDDEYIEEEDEVEPDVIKMSFGDSEIDFEDEVEPNKISMSSEGMELEFEDDGDSEIFSPEERLSMFGDTILGCCVGGGEVSSYARDRLLTVTNPSLFRDENYILFSILFAYRGKLKRIRIDEEFIRLFLNRNRGMIRKARGFIDINAYGEVEGSIELGYIGGVLKHFRRLKTFDPISIEDFETCFEKYLIEFKAIEAEKVYQRSSIILKEGMKIGNKYYMGFDDSVNYSKRKLAEIEGLVDFQKGSGFVTMNEVLKNEKEESKKPYKISDYGRLTKLNEVYGGIYTSTFIQVLAPPKAGKTKFCTRACHTTSVVYGNNVTVWAQEGGKDAWTNQMRAIHFDYTYNTGVDITEKKYGVTQEVIANDKFPSEELKQLEMSSKLDLESNADYGVVDFIDRPFVVETFLDDIDASVRSNNSKLVIVDYLQIIGSINNLSERERISEAYKKALIYCKDTNIAFMTPGQYKQESFNELIKSGDAGSMDMRTSGGGSAEVLRTPDIIFAFWATTQDLMNNTMNLLSMPCRMQKAFPKSPVNMDLGTCQFISVEK